MNKTSDKLPPVTLGIPFLLVVFIILILVTFACLSLSTAKSDYQLTKDSASYKTSYYQASNKAEILLNKYSKGEINETSWTIKINKSKALKVEILPDDNWSEDRLTDDKLEDKKTKGSQIRRGYSISCWQVVSTTQPDYNQNMNLLKR